MNFSIIVNCSFFVLVLVLPIQAQESSHQTPDYIPMNRLETRAFAQVINHFELTSLQLASFSTSKDFDFQGSNDNRNIKFTKSKIEEELFSENPPPKMNLGNGIFRFILELGALGSMGWWGYNQSEGAPRYALMAAVPITTALVWGTFTVPGDPSRGKEGSVPVSGLTRLLIEATIFGGAFWVLQDLGEKNLATGFGSAVILHYTISFDRLQWLLKQ